jgi:structure-specific recognition protein 1
MVTPRGKYSLEFYETFIKMHGKTYDYKIFNKNITRAFLLPKPDNLHVCFIIGLDSPIR